MDFVELTIWLENRPTWQRHVLTGALLVLVARGAWIALPILGVALVVFQGMAGLVLFGKLLIAVALAVLGGALAGAAYYLIGRHVRSVRLIGPWLAGITTVWPYIAVLCVVIRFIEPGKGPSTWREFAFVLAFMTLWAGLLTGLALFRDD